MESGLTTFHHIGLAVRDFAPSVRFYGSLGYHCSEPIVDPLQQVELIMCRADNLPAMELIKPTGDNSPVSNILKDHPEALYHTCYEVSDLASFLENINRTNRIFPIGEPKPAQLFGNRRVSFYYVQGVGILELLEV